MGLPLSQEIWQGIVESQRLDLAIKYRYFKHILTATDPDSERVYRWHIEARTGGREPGSWKVSIEDYVEVCHWLALRMPDDGFDVGQPIVIGLNGRLRDGAHRLACALACGVVPYWRRHEKPGIARHWDAMELIRCGIADDDMSRVKEDYKELSCLRPYS